jgi:hypothetical protein
MFGSLARIAGIAATRLMGETEEIQERAGKV